MSGILLKEKSAKRLLVILAVMTAMPASGYGEGERFRLGLEFGNPSAVIILRPAPLDFRIGYSFDADDPYMFLSGDYRAVNSYPLVDFLHCFLGVGAYLCIYFQDSAEETVNFGARFPLGLQVFLFDSTLELFLEVCPTVKFFPALVFNDFMGYLGFTIPLPFSAGRS